MARPGSQVRHLYGLGFTRSWERVGTDIVWSGACSRSQITTPDRSDVSPFVNDEDMHLYRPCKRCVWILKNRVDWYREILDAAWMDIRAAEPKESVG